MTSKTEVDELRFAVGPHASGGVGIEFRKPISWMVLNKEEATRMAFLLLEHAGVKFAPNIHKEVAEIVSETTATPPAGHTVLPETGPTS